MPVTTLTVGASVTPTVLSTWFAHYFTDKPPRTSPAAHISYHEGLEIIRRFLYYASHQTIEDFQAFTAQSVPPSPWVKCANSVILPEFLVSASHLLIAQLGPDGVSRVGGSKWWQWRGDQAALTAEWIETRVDYNERRKLGVRSKKTILYFHGGAHFFGSIHTHRYQLQRHARKLKARVFARYSQDSSANFRLAPQFPFPCALQDCIAAYLFLLSLQTPDEIIFAGDSSGAGLALSVLVTLRDQGVALPAGVILISPWVDLTHSFPSVSQGSNDDFLPSYGFMQRPSLAWPPPSSDEIGMLNTSGKKILQHVNSPPVLDSGELETKVIEDYYARQVAGSRKPSLTPGKGPEFEDESDAEVPLTINVEGGTMQIRDQIHMYTTNHLLSHPLVSPVLQPSLGGLPPMLVITGGGELLRDEQIYLAHKAANPERYPPGQRFLDMYDPTRTLVSRYPPTRVQLQVWDGLCHVPTTLSFTRPAKYVFRSIAQFGAWCFSHAQDRSIDIRDNGDAPDSIQEQKSLPRHHPKEPANVNLNAIGKAGDPLPSFQNHMIRQRVRPNGEIRPLEVEEALPALQMPRDEIGEPKIGPIQRWVEARQRWDAKYAKDLHKVRRRRTESVLVGIEDIAPGDRPPPASAAARRGVSVSFVRKPTKTSRMLALWSLLCGREDTKKLQEESNDIEKAESPRPSFFVPRWSQEPESARQARRASRQRTVTDTGQANGSQEDLDINAVSAGGGVYNRDSHIAGQVSKDQEPGPATDGYSSPEKTVLESPLDEAPPIPLRALSRRDPDKASTQAVRSATGVITPKTGSPSSALEWETPLEEPSAMSHLHGGDSAQQQHLTNGSPPLVAPLAVRKSQLAKGHDARWRDSKFSELDGGYGRGGADGAYGQEEDRGRSSSDLEPFPRYAGGSSNNRSTLSGNATGST